MDMQEYDQGYRFSYDVGAKNMLVPTWHRKGDEIRVVDVPLMTALDPEGIKNISWGIRQKYWFSFVGR
mgnify:CR=1 FL=1